MFHSHQVPVTFTVLGVNFDAVASKSDNSDESWVAEAPGEGETDNQMIYPRPSFIPLSKNEDEDCPSVCGDSPLYSYSLGEGTANVVQRSSLLLTPGTEAPVERVSNPLFALPEASLAGQVPITLPRLTSPQQTCNPPQPGLALSGDTCPSQLSLNFSGQTCAGHSLLAVSGQARGNAVTSTYTVTMTRPLMASTVARVFRSTKSSAPSLDDSPGRENVVRDRFCSSSSDGCSISRRSIFDNGIIIILQVQSSVLNSFLTTPTVERSHTSAADGKSPFLSASFTTQPR